MRPHRCIEGNCTRILCPLPGCVDPPVTGGCRTKQRSPLEGVKSNLNISLRGSHSWTRLRPLTLHLAVATSTYYYRYRCFCLNDDIANMLTRLIALTALVSLMMLTARATTREATATMALIFTLRLEPCHEIAPHWSDYRSETAFRNQILS